MFDGFMLDYNGYGPLLSMKKTEMLPSSEEQSAGDDEVAW